MIQIKNRTAYSDEGKLLYCPQTKSYSPRMALINGMTAESFEEVDNEPPYPDEEYCEMVDRMVKERYPQREENARLRKMLAASVSGRMTEEEAERARAEFEEFDAFVEDCKLRAKEALEGRGQSDEVEEDSVESLEDNVESNVASNVESDEYNEDDKPNGNR